MTGTLWPGQERSRSTKKYVREPKGTRTPIAGKIIIVVLTFGLDDVQQAAKGSRRSGCHVVISGLHEYPYRAALFAVCLDAADLGDYKKPFLLFGLTFIKKPWAQGRAPVNQMSRF